MFSIGRMPFFKFGSQFCNLLLIVEFVGGAGVALASPNPNAEPIDSPLSRSTASTTTETKPYVAAISPGSAATLLYSGSRGSKLEPCGCRSLNLGGIDHEAAMVQAVRGITSATVTVDAGGFFREFTDENMRLQTYHLLEALKKLDVQAINVGYPDLRQSIGNLIKLRDELGLPLISANIINTTTHSPVFEPYKMLTIKQADGKILKVAVLGVTAPSYGVGHPTEEPVKITQPAAKAPALLEDELAQPAPPEVPAHQEALLRSKWTISAAPSDTGESEIGGAGAAPAGGGSSPALTYAFSSTTATVSTPYEIADEAQTLKPLVEKLRPDADLIILASYTGWDRTRKLVETVPGIDVAIAGEFLRHYDPEQVGPSKTWVVATDHDGKYLGQVDLHLDGNSKLVKAVPQLQPILQSIAPAKEYTAFIEAYSRESASLPIPEGQKIAEKLYAGAITCRTCHAMEYAQWKTHPHSYAMKALVDKGMQYNVDCLRCHTVAYRQPGGFTDLRVTPGLSNVQCEVCHGAGQKHAEEQQKLALAASANPAAKPTSGTVHLKMTWDQNFCIQCHDPANDPNFKFDEDIIRVHHRNPAAARVRPTTASLTM